MSRTLAESRCPDCKVAYTPGSPGCGCGKRWLRCRGEKGTEDEQRFLASKGFQLAQDVDGDIYYVAPEGPIIWLYPDGEWSGSAVPAHCKSLEEYLDWFEEKSARIRNLTPAQPDILVTGPDGIKLVVETKTAISNLERLEEQLKRYMSAMQCPTGMLITPEHMWLYHDLYTARLPQSIQRVGEFDMRGLWPQPPPAEATSFEVFVQQWLERLAQEPSRYLPLEIGGALQEYILPAVVNGEVRAAHPRYH
jgi:hypothetical protein